MYSRVFSFVNKNNILYDRQYGFRAGHSCDHALLDAQHTLHNILDKRETAILLLIDFSKAFDMVTHDILLHKLYYYGIRGLAHAWFKSYLSQRKQYVVANGSMSAIGELTHGVPQGSILGPLLFVLFINDMPNILEGIHFILYADDANIIISCKNIGEIEEKINALIPKLTKWITRNSLKLNTDKTKYMLISNMMDHNFDIRINK